jgi:hypothetical protein
MSNQYKIMRIETNEDKEAKNLMTMIREKIYKDYNNTPHVEETYEGAINTVEDLVLIQETIARLIKRRNDSYIVTENKIK